MVSWTLAFKTRPQGCFASAGTDSREMLATDGCRITAEDRNRPRSVLQRGIAGKGLARSSAVSWPVQSGGVRMSPPTYQHPRLFSSLLKSLSRNPGLRRIFQGGKANLSCDTMFLTGFNRPKAQQNIGGLDNIADMDRSSHPIGEADRDRRMKPDAIHDDIQRSGSALGCYRSERWSIPPEHQEHISGRRRRNVNPLTSSPAVSMRTLALKAAGETSALALNGSQAAVGDRRRSVCWLPRRPLGK